MQMRSAQKMHKSAQIFYMQVYKQHDNPQASVCEDLSEVEEGSYCYFASYGLLN